MEPFVSDLKITPSSTGESGPTSVVAGTVEFGQIVNWVCAEEFNEQPNATTSTRSTFLAYFNLLGLNAPPAVSNAKSGNLRCGVHKNKNSPLRNRTTTPPDLVFFGANGSPRRWLGVVATKSGGKGPWLMGLAEQLKFGNPGVSATHS
jgi:hypothetical protein